MRVPLHSLAHTRSGDKGDTVNIAVIPYEPEFYAPLEQHLTEEALSRHYAGLIKGSVTRYAVDKLGVLNFVCDRALGGGVSRSLRLDQYGKSLAAGLLTFPVDIADDLAGKLVGPGSPTGMTEIAGGLKFPEGPIALDDGSFLVVEIAAGRLTRISADGRKHVVAVLGGGPNGAAIGPDGKCYVCNNGGMAFHDENGLLHPTGQSDDYSGGRIERVDLATDAVETLYTACEGVPLKGPNDLVFDKAGGFWFTDYGKIRPRDIDRGGVYYARADGGGIREVIHPMLGPNGVGLSPDEDRLYVAETATGRLWAFEIVAPGEIRKRPWPSPNGGECLAAMDHYAGFDSLAVEPGGDICVATLFTGAVTVFSPRGQKLRSVAFPDAYVTNLCFGGPGNATAYVTLSRTGRLVALPWLQG